MKIILMGVTIQLTWEWKERTSVKIFPITICAAWLAFPRPVLKGPATWFRIYWNRETLRRPSVPSIFVALSVQSLSRSIPLCARIKTHPPLSRDSVSFLVLSRVSVQPLSRRIPLCARNNKIIKIILPATISWYSPAVRFTYLLRYSGRQK